MSDTSQVHQRSSQAETAAPLLWTHVVNSRRKGNNRQQQSIVSFNPTIVKRPVTEAEASQQAINGDTSPPPQAVIRPFLKGVEQDSVFIDLTPIKDRNLLNKALLQFNEASNAEDMYEEFLGYRKQPRHYLNHAFLETMWLPNSEGRKTLIEEGITLEDGTFVKGFASYHADATIVKLTLENLPFLPALQLKEEMAARLSAFGDVLDHGISRTDGIYQGEGYATLNLTVPSSPGYECQELHPVGKSCPGHRHLEKLSRVIVWDLTASDQRKVLLQWDQMPAFCRNCQSSEHCRADCPDYKKWVRCHHCNETGHVVKNCSRNDSPNKVRAVENTPAKPRKGSQVAKEGKKGTQGGSKVTPGGAPVGNKGNAQGKGQDVASGGSQGDSDNRIAATQQGSTQGDADSQTGARKQVVDRDVQMDDLPKLQVKEVDGKGASNDIIMYDSSTHSANEREERPERPAKKIGKFNGADDVSSAKQQAASNEVETGHQLGLTGPPSPPQH
ncbi:Saccharopine dehydrogenase [Mucor velutinosus]|uniref:Saccharopine dehydrogenase n=1 Tax=Mucor velutinosus TaxID=708070 RepID=A0AAN7D381_9FUNG|nr:Small nuclear ribonucleoprotein G (snRNP-G) [Mucor velutinosus]KAK4516256.1 Saccharopine dehydrogenase [Mucor velutinosus]